MTDAPSPSYPRPRPPLERAVSPTPLRLLPAWLVLTLLPLPLLIGPGCRQTCPTDACEQIPDDPWVPYGDDDDATYGDDDTSDDDDDDAQPDDDDAQPDDDDVTPPPVVTVRDCEVTLEHTPDGSPGTLFAAGEWNAWDPTTDELTDGDGDGVWSANLGELEPGEYGFKYVVDGGWEGDPPINAYTHWNDGSENRNLRVLDCEQPLLQVITVSASSSGTVNARIQFASAEDESPLDFATVVATVGGSPVTATLDTGEIVVSASGLAPGKHSVRVWASDEAGRPAENEPLYVPLWVEADDFEWADATMYFAFTDRFRNGDTGNEPFGPVSGVETEANYQGGDFLGILDAMDDDYFDDLGVNLLWLSPMYENPDAGYAGNDGHQYSGFHGYWPTMPTSPESRFGDANSSAEDRLHELIDEAHSRGIRVLFDLVLNHVHEDHVYTGQYPTWFDGGGCVCGSSGCSWDDHAIDCWFMPYLPDLDYRNHEIVEKIVDDVLTMAKEYDVDAFRVDAAKHMDHVIMRTLSMRLRDEFEIVGGAPFYLVGETYVFTDGHSQIMNYVNPWELDGQFDFPLLWTARDAFAGWTGFDTLEGQVATGEGAYGDYLMSPFIGNHDILRYSTLLAGNDQGNWGASPDLMAGGGGSVTEWDIINKMSMGFAFVLTQHGVPLIYYGDEIGLAGGGDPDNRRFMSFDSDLSANQETLLARIQTLGQIRQDSVALRRGDRELLWVDGDLYVYARDAGSGEVAIVAMNKGSGTRTEEIAIPSSMGIDGYTLTDGIGAGQVSVSGNTTTISLGSWEYAIYEP